MDLYDQIEAELALCRGTVCAIASLTAAALTATPHARRSWARGHLRRGAISGVIAATVAISCGAGAAAAAFHSPQRVLTGIAYHGHHGHHGRRRRDGWVCGRYWCGRPFWVP